LFRTPIKDSFLTVYFSLIITHTTGVTYVRMVYAVEMKCINDIVLLGIRSKRGACTLGLNFVGRKLHWRYYDPAVELVEIIWEMLENPEGRMV